NALAGRTSVQGQNGRRAHGARGRVPGHSHRFVRDARAAPEERADSQPRSDGEREVRTSDARARRSANRFARAPGLHRRADAGDPRSDGTGVPGPIRLHETHRTGRAGRPGDRAVTDKATYSLDGHVATITYNRPDVLNAIDAELRRDLNDAWRRFKEEDDAWVAILTGAGRAFSAGVDLRNPAGAVGEWPGSFWEIPTINSFESGEEIWKPTIAAVNGPCIGYGL